jgi:putative DNA methylase
MSDRSFIETQFPIAPLSAESYKERKANLGQTLTRLGKWWGRKPLVLVRASVLGLLMPASDDPKKDREIFLKLMTMDPDGLWRRRKGKVNDSDIVKRAPEYKDAWRSTPKEERDELREEIWENLSDEDRVALEENRRFKFAREEFDALSYGDKLAVCLRPEEIDGPDGKAWADINDHLGTTANSLAELVEQIGERRFGRRPRVGDCFCGGGSIPFEAARIGCDAFASDLNPVAGLLTWANANLVGGGRDLQQRIREVQETAFLDAAKQVEAWGIERNGQGWRAEAYLYCVEVKPPGCEYYIPLAPSWMIGERSRVIAKIKRSGRADRLDIEIHADPIAAEWEAAKAGTIADSRVIDPLKPGRSWSIEELRGPGGLRLWESSDLVPRPDDIFQERLYCIRWITPDGTKVYAAPTQEDLEREGVVLELLKERLNRWQDSGFIPSTRIPDGGEKTEEPIRTRGWTYWHHLFTPRQLLVNGLLASSIRREDVTEQVAAMLGAGRLANWNSRLCQWLADKANEKGSHVFANQALNPMYSHATRPLSKLDTAWPIFDRWRDAKIESSFSAVIADARDIDVGCDYWVTDPPYADAINYHELGEFFLAWYDQQLPRSFPGWFADSRQALAVRGSGDDFKRSMVEIYSNLTRHMHDNGLQLVMFTHQNPTVWADLGMILWAAGLRVTAAWTVATETPAGGIKKGEYVQATVLLVLRKRLSQDHGFLDEVYPMVEDEVRRQIDSMRSLDEGVEPNFGDTDYQLAAYAAALRVLTQFQTLDGQDIGHELFRAPDNGGRGRNVGKSRFEQVILRGIEIACDYLVPRGLDNVWRGLTPDERLYLRALDVESRGERRQGVYQELARGFGVREFRPLLRTTTANCTRVKTPGDFGRKDLTGEGFGGTQLRQLLFAIHTTRSSETPDAGLRFLKDEVANYWSQRQRLIAILDWLAELGRGEAMEHWLADSEAARLLAGRLRGDHG